jgi:pimeloyl-ACP methyl ester carboxylesterase
MGSGGTFGGGRDELRDVRAAIGAIRERAAGPTLLFGWSFGASVALREAFDDERVSALALFGIPLHPNDLTLPPLPTPAELRLLKRPLLLLTGEHDEYCPADELRAYGDGVAEVVIIENTDHYLWRHERDAAAIVGDFADRMMALPG